jgi:hypothetical protein
VFRDDRAPTAERYKLWTKYRSHSEPQTNFTARPGLWAMVSPDGLRWSLIDDGYPLSRGNAADSQNIPFGDKDVGHYVAFVRVKKLATSRDRIRWWQPRPEYREPFLRQDPQ